MNFGEMFKNILPRIRKQLSERKVQKNASFKT